MQAPWTLPYLAGPCRHVGLRDTVVGKHSKKMLPNDMKQASGKPD